MTSVASRARTVAGTLRARLGAGGIVCVAALAVIFVAVFWPTVLAPGDPLAIHPTEAFLSPRVGHVFGTDESGRDIYTRVVHGAAASAGVGLAATAIGVGVGVVLGFAAGLGPDRLDAALGRIIEVLFALPTLVMALLLVAIIGPGVTASVVAIGAATAPGYARVLRARVRTVVRSDYVRFAHLEATPPWRVFTRHIVPNSLAPLASIAAVGVAQAIVWVSALSFLGLGAVPPSPEWGAMLNAGRVYIASAWWMTVFPGLAIVVTALVLTVLGRRLSNGGVR
ncbi:ABC transporter permease [Microbacterium aquimaris]|uniref:ABC transporter permease n=1 Tax=Microbacterium aquimaris TaxID=459816 RepID=UPI002AD3F287|nr:ABC transporter permease [Microbacterium aquimaris]MDZ8277051.1 ABC transporter permease [Microbacterium aquimaris]